MGIRMSKVLGKSRFLKAVDADPPLLVTIKNVTEEEVGDDRERKYVLRFDEVEKGLVLNVTNGETITEIIGSDDSDQWRGHKVVLFKDKTDYGGKRVDCIRVREPRGKAAKSAVQTQNDDLNQDEIPF